jgi:GNAT superfamily N-acetyltransferase
MAHAIGIRPAEVADAPAVSALIGSLLHYRTDAPAEPAPASFLAKFTPRAIEGYVSDPKVNYLVAEVDGELAGVLGLRDNSHLFHLFVAAPFQGRGIARALWERARAEAQAAGNVTAITVRSSLYAVPVYARFGFVATGPRTDAPGVTYVPMRLDLR